MGPLPDTPDGILKAKEPILSNFIRVSWNPSERVARAASYVDNHFGPHQYGVKFEGDERVYRPEEVEIPILLVLVPKEDRPE